MNAIRLAPLVLLAAGCAPPAPIPVAQAEAICVRSVLNGGNQAQSVTIGVGTGGGWDDGWGGGYGGGWGGGTGIAVTTPLPNNANPAQQYNDCVLRRSGQPPVTAFADRPELKG